MILLGITAAVLGGFSMPIMIILFGDLTNAFVQNDLNTTQVCAVVRDCCDEAG